MNFFKDDLEYYNNLDVIPFAEAVEKMKVFYRKRKLDIFKDDVSLPGLVLKYLMKSTDSKFSLFQQKDKDLYDGIVGDPSIIFKRYVEAGKTYISNGYKYVKRQLYMMQMHYYYYGLYLNECPQVNIIELNHMI